MDFESQFIAYYKSLVEPFIKELALVPQDDFSKLPQPFLPTFGEDYERAKLRVAFVGMETRGWGDVESFIKIWGAKSSSALRDELAEFRTLQFAEWGNNFGYTFFDFVMFFLAAMHKLPDWKVLKRGLNDTALKGFAWCNCNAFERYDVSSKAKGASYEAWKTVKAASIRFDQARHIVQGLDPDVMVILWKGMQPTVFFEGLDYSTLLNEGDFAHYFLTLAKVHVFHVPHPQYMKFHRGKEYFAKKLLAAFADERLHLKLPTFIRDSRESERFIRTLPKTTLAGDKYEYITQIAQQLKERDCIMSILTLVSLLNASHYTTNYDTPYSGGRGSYRLIKATYDRCIQSGKVQEAEAVAKAFVNPNGEYAYA